MIISKNENLKIDHFETPGVFCKPDPPSFIFLSQVQRNINIFNFMSVNGFININISQGISSFLESCIDARFKTIKNPLCFPLLLNAVTFSPIA